MFILCCIFKIKGDEEIMVYKQTFYQPDKDGGWGLIFRLHHWWDRVDNRADAGNNDGWEIALDRIWANLLYRNPMEIIKDEYGKIIDVRLTENDKQTREILKQKINRAKAKLLVALKMQNKKLFNQAKEEWYNALMDYDVWVRKFMQEHQLYLKEIESNPSQALFGGAFRK